MALPSQLKGDMQFIIEQILLSPSGDNTQPWRFVVDGTTIELWYVVPNDVVPELFWKSIKGRAITYLTFGILIENAVIAASVRGYSVVPSYFPNKNEDLYIAKITLIKKASIAPDPLIEAISGRSTNRNPYDMTPLLQNDRMALMNVSSSDTHQSLMLLESREIMHRSMGFITRYEEILFSNKLLHRRFFSLINWTKKIDEMKRVGFYIASLSTSLVSIFGLWVLQHWRIARLGTFFSMQKFIAREQQTLHLQASAFGFIYGTPNTDTGWIETGRYMERIWLTAYKNGLSLQPMSGSLVIRSITGTKEESQLLTPVVSKMINEDYNTLLHTVGLKDTEEIHFMFRIGYTDQKVPKTLRRPLQDMVTLRDT